MCIHLLVYIIELGDEIDGHRRACIMLHLDLIQRSVLLVLELRPQVACTVGVLADANLKWPIGDDTLWLLARRFLFELRNLGDF